MSSARQRFLDYVRRVPGAKAIVSPFLPKPELIAKTLDYLGLPISHDYIADETRLSQELDYEPMFMTDCSGLMFPWKEDKDRSDDEWSVSAIPTQLGEWVRQIPRKGGLWGDESGFPIKAEADHEKLAIVCGQVNETISL